MALFESYERRIDKINGVLAQYGISSVEECREICKAKGFDPYEIVGYQFITPGKMMHFIKKGIDANEALEKAKGHYGQWDNAAKYIDPRQE